MPFFEGFERFDVSVGAEAERVTIHGVRAGDGPPLLLLHGYPQTHVLWRKIAHRLAQDFTVVATDLRGYGASTAPPARPDHAQMSKRASAADQVAVMRSLGFDRFGLIGHDRGGRVAHRLALDHPDVVTRVAVLDIAPTHHMYTTADKAFATGYYHWFFLIQPSPVPETLIGAEPRFFLENTIHAWSGGHGAVEDEAFEAYVRAFGPERIHTTCEDYRASAGIDLEHDEDDMHRKLSMPLLVLWGAHGFVERRYDVLATWRERASDVRGRALDCGHFVPEEAPDETFKALSAFFGEAS